MTHDQERERFEKWFLSEGYPEKDLAKMMLGNYEAYVATRTAGKWLAWQARAHDSRCGELVEAVAWMVQGKQCGEPATFLYYKDEWPKAHAEHGDKVTPLFTHPPEAMAVTDEMVERACIAAAAYAKLVDKNADAWNEYSEDEKANCRSLFRAAIKAMATTPRGG